MNNSLILIQGFLIILLSISIIIILFFIIFGVFTTVSTGTRKFIIHGEKYLNTLYDNSSAFFLWDMFGFKFLGLSIFNYSIKTFTINVDKVNKYGEKNDPTTWIIKNEPKTVDHLREIVVREIVVMGAELGGENPIGVDIGFQVILELIKEIDTDGKDGGARFIFNYNADFKVPENLIIPVILTEIAKFESYTGINEVKEDFMDLPLKSNDSLKEGLKKIGFNLINVEKNYLTTNKEVETAASKKTIAELEASATKIGADAEAYKLKTKGGAELEGLVETLKKQFPNVTEEELLRRASEILEKRALSSAPGLSTIITDLFKK